MILAAILLVVPIAIVAILLFGGGQVNQCLGLGCASLPQPEPTPVVGTTAGLVAVLVVLGIGWLVAAAVALRSLLANDRSRAVRVVAVTVGLVITTALATVVLRLAEDQRLRVVAEDAGLYAIGAAIIAIPVTLSLAVLTARQGPPTARP